MNRKQKAGDFIISNEDLKKLGPKEGVKLIQDLMRCTVFSAEGLQKDIIISNNINESDGGIDAKVSNVIKPIGILSQGTTCYQIKTGTSFKPWQDSALRKELFGSQGEATKEKLGQAVRNCLDKNETYVIITLGHDLSPANEEKATQQLIQIFKDCDYLDPKVHVYGQTQIINEISQYPSLCLELLGIPKIFWTLSQLKATSKIKNVLKLGKPQKDFIYQIQKNLSDKQHIRIIGKNGIGKTHLVLDAVSDEKISLLVLYCFSVDEFLKESSIHQLIKTELPYYTVLIIDNCCESQINHFFPMIEINKNIRLITIGSDKCVNNAKLKTIECPVLEDEEISSILMDYIGKKYDLFRWVSFCKGSPAIAHLLGENLKNEDIDILGSSASKSNIESLIDCPTSKKAQYNLILCYISLFGKIDLETNSAAEFKFVLKLIQDCDPSISSAIFQDAIKFYKEKGVLSGNAACGFFSKAIHIYLWLKFWEDYSLGFSFASFFNSLPERMHERFLSLFKYSHASPKADKIVKELLSSNFANKSSLLHKLIPLFLIILSEACPSDTLKYIEKNEHFLFNEALNENQKNRGYIFSALEKIAVHAHLFDRAANKLISLHLKKDLSNDKEKLLNLFSIKMGSAPTQAPPSRRLPLIKMLMESENIEKFNLGKMLCSKWFETDTSFRIIEVEHQGLRDTIKFWQPATYKEIFDYWNELLDYLLDFYKDKVDKRSTLISIFIDASSSLIHIAAMTDRIFKILFLIANDKTQNRDELIFFLNDSHFLNEPKLKNKWRLKLIELQNILSENTIFNKIQIKILTNNSRNKVDMADLLKESMSNYQECLPKLLSISNDDSNKLNEFSYEWGRSAHDEKWDQILIDEVKKFSGTLGHIFAAGYISGVRNINESRWQKILINFLKIPGYYTFASECVSRCGITDNILRRMVFLLENGELSYEDFNLYSLARDKKNVSETTFLKLINNLNQLFPEESREVSIFLLYNFYCDNKAHPNLPKILLFNLLTKKISVRDNMICYYWKSLSKRFLFEYPKKSIDFFENLVEILSDFFYQGKHRDCIIIIANDIVKVHPLGTWKIISHLLALESIKKIGIIKWLSGPNEFSDSESCSLSSGQSAISYIDPKIIMHWVKQDDINRKNIILEILPKTLNLENGGNLTIQFINLYYDDVEISDHIVKHLTFESYRGFKSEYLTKKLETIENLASTTANSKISDWLANYIDYLKKEKDDAIREEEISNI